MGKRTHAREKRTRTYVREKAERLLSGFAPEPLTADAVSTTADRWRAVFANAAGNVLPGGHDWHAFSENLVYALTGERSRAEYRKRQRQQEFVILIGCPIEYGFQCRSESLPWLDRAGIDAYVVAADFAWTMVFTHEGDWCGPYFTTADWCSSRSPAAT